MELCLLFNTFIIPSTRQTVPFHIIKEVHFLHLASTLLRSWIAPRLLPQKHCILCLVPNGCCCLCTSSLMCSLSSCCNLAVIYFNMCCISLRFFPSFECTDALGIIYTVDFPMWDFRLFRVAAQWETETGAHKNSTGSQQLKQHFSNTRSNVIHETGLDWLSILYVNLITLDIFQFKSPFIWTAPCRTIPWQCFGAIPWVIPIV